MVEFGASLDGGTVGVNQNMADWSAAVWWPAIVATIGGGAATSRGIHPANGELRASRRVNRCHVMDPPRGTETSFDYNMDQRIGLLWQCLDTGPHPFSPSQVEEYRQTLLDLMRTVPRLIGPMVEPTRRAENRTLRAQPLKVDRK
jgi:hypothetical protein